MDISVGFKSGKVLSRINWFVVVLEWISLILMQTSIKKHEVDIYNYIYIVFYVMSFFFFVYITSLSTLGCSCFFLCLPFLVPLFESLPTLGSILSVCQFLSSRYRKLDLGFSKNVLYILTQGFIVVKLFRERMATLWLPWNHLIVGVVSQDWKEV